MNSKKSKIIRMISLWVLLCFNFVSIPMANAAEVQDLINNQNAYYETSAGELPLEVISQAVLSKEVLPEGMEYNDAVKAGHRLRLYEQEHDLNTVIFENADASKTAYTFADAVKYIDADGKVRDIDNEIITQPQNEEFAFKNKYSDVNIEFGRRLSNGVLTRHNGLNILLKVKGENTAKPRTDSESVVYDNAFGTNTELRYTPHIKGYKEEVILKQYTGENKFDFILDIGDDYVLDTRDDDCVYIVQRTNNTVAALIEPVWMWDAEGSIEKSNQLSYSQNEDGTWNLSIIANEEFLTDTGTVYPVTIDPTLTIQKSSNSTGIQDVTLYSNTAKPSDGASGSLFIGNRTGFGNSRVLMKFPGLSFSGITSASQITSVKVSLRDLMCEAEEVQIGCYAFTGNSWTEATANWSNTSPNSYATADAAFQTVSYSKGITQTPENHRYYFDITAIAKKWFSGSYSKDKGVIFKSTNESLARFKTCGSYNRSAYNPTLVMTYTSATPVTPRTIADGEYYIQNKYSGKFMDYYASGSRAIQWGLHGDTNQIWRVTYNSSGGYYTIVPLAATSKKLYMSGTTAAVGATTSTTSQWKITEVSTGGYYKITNASGNSGLRVAISGTGDAANNVTVESYYSSDAFMWKFEKRCIKNRDFVSISANRSLQNYYSVCSVTENWQKSEIEGAASTWNSAGAASSVNIAISDSNYCTIAANAGEYFSNSSVWGNFEPQTRQIDIYYDSIVAYVNKQSAGAATSVKEARIRSIYRGTVLHELGHALGLDDNPPGTKAGGKATGTPTQAYTIMRYSDDDGYYRWESYWAQNKPQIADIVGVSHPEV